MAREQALLWVSREEEEEEAAQVDSEEHPWHVSLRVTSTILAANCWPVVGIAPSLSPSAGLMLAPAPM